MSDITVTATSGGTINVSTGTVVGPLPQLQVAAGNGITISSSGGVSTISANAAQLAIPSNLADLANVQGAPSAGQVLAWNGTAWSPADDKTGGSSNVSNLSDLADVSATSPSSGQALTWGGSQWEAANVPVGTTVNGLSGNVTLLAGDNINVSADGQNITIGTIGQASISNITDLLDVNATMSPTSGQALVWDGAVWTADSVTALVSNGTTLDLGTGKILYSNVYATLNDLPAAADYHGMFAHVHDIDGLGTGAAFYAHAGSWVRLADNDELPASFVQAVNGLSGAITIAGDSGITVSQLGNQLTLRSTQTFTSLNGETGGLTLVGGDNVQVTTQDGVITVSAIGLPENAATTNLSDVTTTQPANGQVLVHRFGQYSPENAVLSVNGMAGDIAVAGSRDINILSGNGTLAFALDESPLPPPLAFQSLTGETVLAWGALPRSNLYAVEMLEITSQNNPVIGNITVSPPEITIDLAVENITQVASVLLLPEGDAVNVAVPDFPLFVATDSRVTGNWSDGIATVQFPSAPASITEPGNVTVWAAVTDPVGNTTDFAPIGTLTLVAHGNPLPPSIVDYQTGAGTLTLTLDGDDTPHGRGFFDAANVTHHLEIAENASGPWTEVANASGEGRWELTATTGNLASVFARVYASNPLGSGTATEWEG